MVKSRRLRRGNGLVRFLPESFLSLRSSKDNQRKRKMDKERIYRVFVSSPFSLKTQRALIQKAILKSGHLPIMLEHQAAKDSPVEDVIVNALKAADIYIIILGHKYGTLLKNMDVSYTEWEYGLAKNQKDIYKIHLLQEEKEVIARRDKLDRNISSDAAEIKNEERYSNFYSSLNSSGTLNDYWREGELNEQNVPAVDLAIAVSTAIGVAANQLKLDQPTKGLIPASNYEDIDSIDKSSKNLLRTEIRNALNLFDELDQRCSVETELKESIAVSVSSFLNRELLGSGADLYFDSGSSVAFVARAIGPLLKKYTNIEGDGGYAMSKVYTNNSLAYLHLWMKNGVPCNLFPIGPAEPPYGTAIGSLSDYGEQPPEDVDYLNYKLTKSERSIIDHFLNSFPHPKHKKMVIVSGLSGIKMGLKIEINQDKDGDFEKSPEVELSIDEYQGIHVNHYYSKLMARALIESRYPIIYCIHAAKLDYPITLGRCHFVFDGKDHWDAFISKHPAAFCIGYKSGQEEKIKDFMEKTTFTKLEGNESKTFKTIIVGNEPFMKWVEKRAG